VHLENSIVIDSDAHTIYGLAADIEHWPAILPHYRSVTIVERWDNGLVAKMSAWRTGIPVSWTAEQHVDPSTSRIRFEHIGGFTKGMEVEWRFEPGEDVANGGGPTKVTIWHGLTAENFGLRGWLIEHIVASVFIDHIATKTLMTMKGLAERHDRP
jgi:uncharacterized membrane protein